LLVWTGSVNADADALGGGGARSVGPWLEVEDEDADEGAPDAPGNHGMGLVAANPIPGWQQTIFLCGIKKKMSVEQTRKRLQELLAAYPHLEKQAAAQDKQCAPIVAENDLLALYQAYHTWLVWHYALSQDLRQLVNFNVAEDVHQFALGQGGNPKRANLISACKKSETKAPLETKARPFSAPGAPEPPQGSGYALPEPVLEWLPPLLRANGAPVDAKHYTPEERQDAVPLWSDDRLFAFLAAVPRDILRQHALSRGLLGGHAAEHASRAFAGPETGDHTPGPIPRRDLAHGRGWFPVPAGAPWAQQVTMLASNAPFQLSQLA